MFRWTVEIALICPACQAAELSRGVPALLGERFASAQPSKKRKVASVQRWRVSIYTL